MTLNREHIPPCQGHWDGGGTEGGREKKTPGEQDRAAPSMTPFFQSLLCSFAETMFYT